MTGFEPLISGVGSDRFTNCAITTALAKGLFTLAFSSDVFAKDIYYFHPIGFSFFFSWYVRHLGRDGFKNRKFSIF